MPTWQEDDGAPTNSAPVQWEGSAPLQWEEDGPPRAGSPSISPPPIGLSAPPPPAAKRHVTPVALGLMRRTSSAGTLSVERGSSAKQRLPAPRAGAEMPGQVAPAMLPRGTAARTDVALNVLAEGRKHLETISSKPSVGQSVDYL